ncbi:hypothetical protein AQI95_05845 [Streptomyces yokosukanensis]|uniref:Uncharacterized protein n=1 Tax=Streptomyces yokosukanensis TaxID=67386 RepID=A0A124HH81_9ACTN|nr:hypothetical protein AQI95_05845 [Streptomyces yokosukanensis]
MLDGGQQFPAQPLVQGRCGPVGCHDVEHWMQSATSCFRHGLTDQHCTDPVPPCLRSDEETADHSGQVLARPALLAPQAGGQVSLAAAGQTDMADETAAMFGDPGPQWRSL